VRVDRAGKDREVRRVDLLGGGSFARLDDRVETPVADEEVALDDAVLEDYASGADREIRRYAISSNAISCAPE